MSVSPTLVESDSMNRVLSEGKKQSLYRVVLTLLLPVDEGT